MNHSSRLLRRGTRGLIVAGVVAVGLTLDPSGCFRSGAQEPAKPAKDATRKDEPKADLKPEMSLRVQKLRTRKARAIYEIARLNREIADIAVEEYTEGTYPQELAMIENEIKDAEAERVRADERFDRAKRIFEKGHGLKSPLIEELNLKKAEFVLEQCQAKKMVLVKYTRVRTIKGLQEDVEKARKVESDRDAEWKREAARQAVLDREAGRK